MRAIALAAIVLPVGTMLAAQELEPLVSPGELSELLQSGADVRVVDIRAVGKDGYGGGHIEGSVNVPYHTFRGPAENPGQLVPEAKLTEVLQNNGIDPETPVVVSYQGRDVTDFGAAARVYWTLKSSGIENLAILNGGVNAWTEAGFTLTDAQPAVFASDYEVTFSDTWLATEADVQEAISSQEGPLLLDARPESFWKGEAKHDAAARPGTLPMSDYFVHDSWFASGPAIVDADAAKRLAEEAGLTDESGLISFCNTGHWAATNWFALSELAEIENVKLYPESLVGWSNAGYEMANVPGPLTTLWYQIRNAF